MAFAILGLLMEIAIFKQFEKKFGKNWTCSCGTAFQAEWLEKPTDNKNRTSTRYLCQICGREQRFSLTVTDKTKIGVGTDAFAYQLTSDDVLAIKKETANASFFQIKNLARKGNSVKLAALRENRQKAT